MKQICAKIYYLISTREVLIITSECEGSVIETTKEQDMEIYPQLQNKSIDEVNYIELPYGTLAQTFENIKSYSINLETKFLNCVYYTKEELEAMQNENQETQDLNSRVSDISQYLNINQAAVSDVEDFIIQTEQNKILKKG